MTAGDIIHACRYVKKNTTDQEGVTHARVRVVQGPPSIDDGDAGDPGPAEVQASSKCRVFVEVYGKNINTILDLPGSETEDLVIGYVGPSGANEKLTVKNVSFTGFLGQIEIRDPMAGGTVQRYGAEGEAEWGSDDTLATMIVAAADA